LSLGCPDWFERIALCGVNARKRAAISPRDLRCFKPRMATSQSATTGAGGFRFVFSTTNRISA